MIKRTIKFKEARIMVRQYKTPVTPYVSVVVESGEINSYSESESSELEPKSETESCWTKSSPMSATLSTSRISPVSNCSEVT